MRRAKIVFNPMAGPANFKDALENTAHLWTDHGWETTLSPTRYAGHATTLAREFAADGVDLLLAAGGDGTLNETATGLAGTQTILAPLPVGTANSFAKELEIPRPGFFQPDQLLEASRSLLRGRVQYMDLGRVSGGKHDGRYWLLWAGIGVDSYVVDQIEPRPRWLKRLGQAGYVLQSMPVLPTFTGNRMTISVDGEQIEDTFVLVSVANCRLYAGELLLNPNGRLDDGRFEVWMFRGKHIQTAFRYAAEVVAQQHMHDPDVIMRSAKTIRITAGSSLPVQLDGEKAGQTPFEAVIQPHALRLLVPPTAPEDLFGEPGPALRNV